MKDHIRLYKFGAIGRLRGIRCAGRNLKTPEPEIVDLKPEIEGYDKEILSKEDTEVLPEPENESEPEPETNDNHDTES